MNIAIIDADLLGRTRHRFPNLVCEKLSGYWKDNGANVTLKLNYDNLEDFDKVYIAKVFTDTPFPSKIQSLKNVTIGGTGFFFDKAPNLPYEIEHHAPDYSLYDAWLLDKDTSKAEFKEYTNYSIGFLTRGCFRKCPFCVNQKYNKVGAGSPLEEFLDTSRKKICLLDDNFLGYPNCKQLLVELLKTGKPFKFKQGLDERILTPEICELLCSAIYDGDLTFAFDNIEDTKIVEAKLKLIDSYNFKRVKFYVLVGFDHIGKEDLASAFRRIKILMEHKCLPYITRYSGVEGTPYLQSDYRDVYITLARWCNQPSMFKKMSFRDFCLLNQTIKKKQEKPCTAMKALTLMEKECPEIAKEYFDLKF